MTEVGFEPTPSRTAALTQRLRPLGHPAEIQHTCAKPCSTPTHTNANVSLNSFALSLNLVSAGRYRVQSTAFAQQCNIQRSHADETFCNPACRKPHGEFVALFLGAELLRSCSEPASANLSDTSSGVSAALRQCRLEPPLTWSQIKRHNGVQQSTRCGFRRSTLWAPSGWCDKKVVSRSCQPQATR